MIDPTHQVVHECVNVLTHLRSLSESAPLDGESLRRSLTKVMDELAEKARSAGISSRDSEEIKYALVAVADEFALRKSAQVRQVWMQRPLQLHYFNENIAGERFFTRLNDLLADPRRRNVLKVYYLCLLIGFEGKYASSGSRLELEDIRSKAKRALGDWLEPTTMSHHPLAPKETAAPRKWNFPAITVAIMISLFSLTLLVSLYVSSGNQAESLVTSLKDATLK